MEEEIKYMISLPESFYNDLVRMVNSKKNKKMLYTFQDDKFKSLIWLKDGKLWCKDPKGVREIVPIDKEWVLSLNADNMSMRMVFIQQLVKLGIDVEKATDLIFGINPMIEELLVLGANKEKEKYDKLADCITEVIGDLARRTLDGEDVHVKVVKTQT